VEQKLLTLPEHMSSLWFLVAFVLPKEKEQTIHSPKEKEDNTFTKRKRTDNTFTKRKRTDNTFTKRKRTDNIFTKRKRRQFTHYRIHLLLQVYLLVIKIIVSSKKYPISISINGFITRTTRRVSHVEQKLLTLPEHMSIYIYIYIYTLINIVPEDLQQQ
jgi:hypothetical protein